jgi:superoxide dismutase, Fe-Mn family
MEMTRRQVVDGLGILSVAVLAAGSARSTSAKEETPVAANAAQTAVGKHEIIPLPFDPTKLKGLSERLLVSHHDNNYAGAVKNLNKVEEELAQTTKDTPGFLVAGLRDRELTFTNSLILHELYFGNLGGDGKAAGSVQPALANAFGTFSRFEELFRATGMSLAGGSGWAILDFNFRTADVRIYGSGNHTQSLAEGTPLLVMDMYEHAYHIDHGASAASYIDAFFANLRWEEVNRRYERALKASQALRA